MIKYKRTKQNGGQTMKQLWENKALQGKITISARQLISRPCQRCGSLPSPGWELQKCRQFAFLISGTGFGQSSTEEKMGKKTRISKSSMTAPHDAELARRCPGHTMTITRLWLCGVEMSF